jgi:hypothetical protein
LIKWFPIVWKDWQWDHEYILIVLKHKLELVEEAFRSPQSLSMEATKNANDIHHAIEILDKILTTDYYPGEIPEDTNNPDWKERVLNNSRIEEERIQQDYTKLFEFLSNHIREWWD